MGKISIALLGGGWSREREISLKSAETVFRELDKQKYNVTNYDLGDDLMDLIKNREEIDLAFILLHGKFGEDGCIQGFLDVLDIPFVGSGVLPSAMAMNKKIAKEIYKSAGLDVIEDITLTKEREIIVDQIKEKVGPSTVVKPVSEGSSLGMSLCQSKEELLKGIDLAFQYDREIMVEKYVEGKEITCCVLGNSELQTLPLVEIVPNPSHCFFNYQAKYTPGVTKEICPARLNKRTTDRIQLSAVKAHRALKCRVWSRTDMIVQGEKIYLLETNTVPGMTETSLVPLAARAANLSFSQLLDRLIELSLEPAAT